MRNLSGQSSASVEASFQQAVALHDQGRHAEAEKIYRAILKRHPGNTRTLHNLALVLMALEQFDEAAKILRKLLNQEPNSAAAQILLSFTLRNLERQQEALERAERAIAIEPKNAEAHSARALVLVEMGRRDEAKEDILRAIALAPERPKYYHQFGEIARWTADDRHVAALEALARGGARLTREERFYADFALAKAYADLGRIDDSFRLQIRGGASKRTILAYDEAASLRWLDDVSRALDGDWVRRHDGVGEPSALPIFIVGMPRSGTTLVEQILASHPQLTALGERPFFGEALAEIARTPQIPAALATLAQRLPDAEMKRLGALYLAKVRAYAAPGTTRITDKVPSNFRFCGLIHAALPNARIIHLRRDPVETCLSMFSILFAGAAQPYSYDLGELGRYYRAYEAMMADWRAALPDGVMLEVRYEDVVENLEAEARRLLAHCGLPWDDACLAFHATERAVRTASHAQVRQPLYRTSLKRPRPSPELLAPLVAALGDR